MTNEELVQLYQQGNNSVLNDLIEQNTGIVYKMVNRFYINSNSIDKEDLFQEGCMGLMLAAKKYNFNNPKKCKFITYAVYWINQKINRFISTRNTSEEISLETPINNDKSTALKDTLKDNVDIEYTCIENLYNAELKQDLYSSMYKVNTLREREVLEFNYGLCCTIPMEMKEIGELLKISYERVRQEKERGFRKLRHSPVYYKYKKEIEMERQERKYKNVDSLILNWEDKYPELKEYRERYNQYSKLFKV